MKTLTEYIQEAYYETDNWTYLYVQASSRIKWFKDGYLSPQEESYISDNANFVVLSTKKNMSDSKSSEIIMKNFEKKYGKKIDGYQILCNSGDVNTGKLIKKIGSALDKGQITMVEFINTWRKYLKMEPIEKVTSICNDLHIK